MTKWNNPEIKELGVKNTLCDEYDASLLHGQDKPLEPGESGHIPCPYCTHGCPNQNTLDKHIKKVHGILTQQPPQLPLQS